MKETRQTMPALLRKLFRRAGFGLLGGILALLLGELFFRLNPYQLPPWYLATLPHGGYQLLHPGVLEETPIGAVPLPLLFARPSSGPVPVLQGSVTRGMVRAQDSPDSEDFPTLVFHQDDLGFAAPGTREGSEDILFIGDSFTVGTGFSDPPGLQLRLHKETGLSIRNLGLPGIGPQRQEFLLSKLGLAGHPQAVIWFFFGGNDIQDEERLERLKANGVELYTERPQAGGLPKSLLLDLMRTWWSSRRPNSAAPLPGFQFPGQPARPLWFGPSLLRAQLLSEQELAQSPGWNSSQEVLRRVSRELAQRGVPFLLVYVPSKPEVYLRYVEPDPGLFRKMLTFDRRLDPELSEEQLWEKALRNSGTLERMLAEFAGGEGIEFLSLTPSLQKQAAEGQLGYFCADSHWQPRGQAVALEPLKTWLNSVLGNGDERR